MSLKWFLNIQKRYSKRRVGFNKHDKGTASSYMYLNAENVLILFVLRTSNNNVVRLQWLCNMYENDRETGNTVTAYAKTDQCDG